MDKQKAPNPYEHSRGLIGRLNRFLYPIAGPASLGAGHPEEPYRAPADPSCPVCGTPLRLHDIQRGTASRPSQLNCPV
ncbi:hypothetical protein EDF46_0993 [Frondihabitans sp. PhB188]|uniref:hypothetical protein n=1 Tax=Frondihabitans sp. PhB188 TaxID=2485200 RepID=UPI000FBE6857|nr:hypothetical protein [Frondihabitans sp. PhB188]ROQ41611.1 hypothetical protein EDF46_0993 [Frondihabitans sp. PhB188]